MEDEGRGGGIRGLVVEDEVEGDGRDGRDKRTVMEYGGGEGRMVQDNEEKIEVMETIGGEWWVDG